MPVYEGNLHHLLEALNRDAPAMVRPKTLTMLSQISGALDYVHTRTPEVIHRDVKPPNILYKGDMFFLTDFGIAKKVDAAQTVVGTGWYMAPEVRENKAQTPKVDIWSLGVTLVECLCGPPWELVNARSEQAFKVLGEKLKESLPECASMLAMEPEQRPTARAILNDLAKWNSASQSRPLDTAVTTVASTHSAQLTPMDWTRGLARAPFQGGPQRMDSDVSMQLVPTNLERLPSQWEQQPSNLASLPNEQGQPPNPGALSNQRVRPPPVVLPNQQEQSPNQAALPNQQEQPPNLAALPDRQQQQPAGALPNQQEQPPNLAALPNEQEQPPNPGALPDQRLQPPPVVVPNRQEQSPDLVAPPDQQQQQPAVALPDQQEQPPNLAALLNRQVQRRARRRSVKSARSADERQRNGQRGSQNGGSQNGGSQNGGPQNRGSQNGSSHNGGRRHAGVVKRKANRRR